MHKERRGKKEELRDIGRNNTRREVNVLFLDCHRVPDSNLGFRFAVLTRSVVLLDSFPQGFPGADSYPTDGEVTQQNTPSD
jgi:prepilin-type processing-associated H-X9-DG protein